MRSVIFISLLPSAPHNTTSSPPGLVLQPVVPGLNLPASQLLHYTASLGLASVLHEAGHALAAHTAHIRTLGAGLLIMVGRVGNKGFNEILRNTIN